MSLIFTLTQLTRAFLSCVFLYSGELATCLSFVLSPISQSVTLNNN